MYLDTTTTGSTATAATTTTTTISTTDNIAPTKTAPNISTNFVASNT